VYVLDHYCFIICLWSGLFLCSQVRFSEDIGEIYKVRLGFDDDNDAEQNWLLDTVKINLLPTVSGLTLW